jgi:hypothetical protein
MNVKTPPVIVWYLLVLLALASTGSSAQPDYMRRIQRKVENDFRYSVVLYSDYISTTLLGAEPLRSKIGSTRGASYEVVWMILKDARVPLSVTKTWTESRSPNIFDRATGNDTTITSTVISFSDFERLAAEQPNAYKLIVDYLGSLNVEERRQEKLNQLFSGVTVSAPVFGGMVDFWNYAKLHSTQVTPGVGEQSYLPPPLVLAEMPETADSALSDVRALSLWQPAQANPSGISLDLSVSRIALSHSVLTSENALGVLSFGAEFSFADRVLNHHPFQSPVWTWGATVMFNLTGEAHDILDHDFFWLRALGKSKFDSRQAFDFIANSGLHFLFAPLMSYDQPLLNVTPGATLEAGTSRLWNFPFFLSVYLSTGAKEYGDPVMTRGEGKGMRAYWSTIQWDATMTFFWNLDSDPDYFLHANHGSRLNQFRLDLGAGSYDVKDVEYDERQVPVSATPVIKGSRVQPLVAFEFTHASRRQTRFGARVRYFDNKIDVGTWLDLLKLGAHEVRLEAKYISSPIGRSRFAWETAGGTLIQLRYRVGY